MKCLRLCAAVALLCAAVASPLNAQAPAPAPAATTVTSGSAVPTSTVTVPPSANPTTVVVPPTTTTATPDWLNMLAVISVAVTMSLVGWGVAVANRRAGVQNNTAVLQAEAMARDTLQSALTNLAGRAVMTLGPKINSVVLNIQNPLIRQLAQEAPSLAGDALKLFGITRPDQIAQKIVDKIGVLTAPNPNANPTSTPGNVAAAPSQPPAA